MSAITVCPQCLLAGGINALFHADGNSLRCPKHGVMTHSELMTYAAEYRKGQTAADQKKEQPALQSA